MRDLTAGSCSRALAAGVSLTLSPEKCAAFKITGLPFPKVPTSSDVTLTPIVLLSI